MILINKKPILQDVLGPNLKVIFCGMAAGKKSAQVDAYYAGQGNKFWNVLYCIGLTDRKLKPNEFKEVLKYGIGLTDLVKDQSGSDTDVHASRSDCDNLTQKILGFKPKALAFNGKKAAKVYLRKEHIEYGPQCELIGDTKVFVLPSTSRAACGEWNQKNYEELIHFVKCDS